MVILTLLLVGCSSLPYYTTAETRQKFLMEHPDTPEDIKKNILSQQVSVGMTKDQVIAALGKPGSVGSTTSAYINMEVWTYYQSNLLYFDGDKLASITKLPS